MTSPVLSSPIKSRYLPGEITKLCDAAIGTATASLARIAALPPEQRSIDTTLLAFETAMADFGDATLPLTLMGYVYPDPAIAAEGSACEEKAGMFVVSVFTRRDLYDAIKTAAPRSPEESRLLAETLRQYVPPGGTRGHLYNLISMLECVEPASTTGIAQALMECSSLVKRRGLLVVLSDFWDNPDQTFDALSRFLHRKFDVLLLHVVHPHELDLPDVHAARFRDLETQGEVEVEPEEIRAAYRELARGRADMIAREAQLRRITHALVHTNRPYLEAIEAYLGFRGENMSSRR